MTCATWNNYMYSVVQLNAQLLLSILLLLLLILEAQATTEMIKSY